MEEIITYTEPTRISVTGKVDTGSIKKYSEVVDKLKVTPRSTSCGITGYKDDEIVFSVSFRELEDAPKEVRKISQLSS